MRKVLKKIGACLASMATLIVSSATWGVWGEIEPPECLK